MPSLEYILNQKKFYKENSIYFDLTQESDIVLVRFITGIVLRDNMVERLERSSDYQKINFVLIYGSNSNHEYRGNLDGLPGFDLWSDATFIGTFLYELLTVRNKLRYIIGAGGCSEGWSVLLSSIKCPYNSIFLINPVINQAPKDMFDPDRLRLINACDYRKNIIEKGPKFANYFDQFDTLLLNINAGVHITIHWPVFPDRSDKMEKDRVMAIPNKRNLLIVEHNMPPDWNPHSLVQYLESTGGMKKIRDQEIATARIVKNIV